MKPLARDERYRLPAVGLHWLMAVLVLALLILGWYMTGVPEGDDQSRLYALHKSLGLSVLALALIRIGWRWRRPPPPLPVGVSRLQMRLAGLTHGALYVLLLVQPLSGYLSSSFSGYPTSYFGVPLPQWGWRDESLNAFFNTTHWLSAWAFALLLVGHVGAALRHVIHGDGLFQRMLPAARR